MSNKDVAFEAHRRANELIASAFKGGQLRDLAGTNCSFFYTNKKRKSEKFEFHFGYVKSVNVSHQGIHLFVSMATCNGHPLLHITHIDDQWYAVVDYSKHDTKFGEGKLPILFAFY